MENKKEFLTAASKRLQLVRKSRELTQKDFGEPAGIDRRYVAKCECGSQTPSINYIITLCMFHGISFDYVFLGMRNPPPEEFNFDLYFPEKEKENG